MGKSLRSRLTLNERQLAGPWVNAMLFYVVCFYPLSACDYEYILLFVVYYFLKLALQYL